MIFLTLLTTLLSYSETINLPPKNDFFFGIANAPTQVEDQLEDPWIEHAKSGKVRAYFQTENPEKKLEFWTKPEIEIDLAQELGVNLFRLGIDWSRLMIFSPPLKEQQIDYQALDQYKNILSKIKANKMKVMLTLFHHSEPFWTLEKKSWSNPEMINQFVFFAKAALPELIDQVDFIITFNEPQFYIAMTGLKPIWPSYQSKNHSLELFNLPFKKGLFQKSLENIAEAHKRIYAHVKKIAPQIKVGIAHNVANYRGVNWPSEASALISWHRFNYEMLDLVKDHLDFMGINYYGAENLSGTKLKFDKNYEYSDSGRAISPQGLYKIVHRLQKRYGYLNLPYIVTENGIADESDRIRPLYLIEHLKVVNKLMNEGIKFLGYIHWTLTDNFEWTDGYCPKFGLVGVNRKTMKRTKRESYFLFQRIIESRKITDEDQIEAWEKVATYKNDQRPTCRDLDGEKALDHYRYEKFKGIDWRMK
ncbi:MAG: family 1 glycosylhydrolase [Bacteriovoracaceae bacterium]